MAATQEQINALEAALYSGEKTVRFADREVTFRSLDEIRSALEAARNSQRPRRRLVRLYDGSDK